MRKLVVLFVLMLGLSVAGGCATTKSAFHSTVKESVYLDPDHTWSNSPVKCMGLNCGDSPIRSITLRIINKRYVKVGVKVSCTFKVGASFGSKTVTVKPRNDKVFMVMGMAPHEFSNNTATCRITAVHAN